MVKICDLCLVHIPVGTLACQFQLAPRDPPPASSKQHLPSVFVATRRLNFGRDALHHQLTTPVIIESS
jgi:hypothetical protein